jgi:hypothetical protein
MAEHPGRFSVKKYWETRNRNLLPLAQQEETGA